MYFIMSFENHFLMVFMISETRKRAHANTPTPKCTNVSRLSGIEKRKYLRMGGGGERQRMRLYFSSANKYASSVCRQLTGSLSSDLETLLRKKTGGWDKKAAQ